MHKLKTILVVAAGAASLLMPTLAIAMDGKAASAVNVRSGPGKDFSIVDQLVADEPVNITECAPSGWCYVKRDGPDGWVSAKFLLPADDEDSEAESEGAGSNPDCGFGFSIGSGGPALVVNCGDAAVTPPPAPPAADDEEPADEADGPQACFYKKAGFDGDSFCMAEGTKNSLNPSFNDTITSVEVGTGLKVKLCVDKNLGGYCKTVTVDTDDLPAQIDDKTSSIIVFSGAEPAEEPAPADPPVIILKPKLDPSVLKNIGKLLVPKTYSTGGIDWKQTWLIDLDDGSQASGGDNDLWYEAVTDTEKYIAPQNGAQIATGDYTQHGYTGCQDVDYTTDRIPLEDAAIGSYICVKTNEGRTSEFRVNGFDGTTMKIGYATWAN